MKRMVRYTAYAAAAPIALVAALVALGATSPRGDVIPAGFSGRHVEVDGMRLRIADSGSGEKAVLLVHGSVGSLEDWNTVVPLLERQARVIAVDRPGHGFSSAPAESASVALNARTLRQLCATLQLQDVVVVGHSYGGAIALKLASEGGAPFRGFVLVAPVAYPDFPPSALERLVTLPVIGRGALRALMPAIGEDRIRQTLARLIAPNPAPAGFVDQRVQIWLRVPPLHTHAEQLLAVNDEVAVMAEHYAAIRAPVVILQGEADGATTLPASARRLARAIPGAELREFAATGHYLQVPHPQAVVEAVQRVWKTAASKNP